MAYRVGIVGASGIVINTPRGEPSAPLDKELYSAHVGSLSNMPGVELAAICDIAPEALERFTKAWSERWPEARLYADYRDMLEREDLDILTVATSDHRHAQIVIDGAESGVRGIFCEKPIATTLEDADAMIAACERNGVKMSVNHSRRWFPLYHKVRHMIRNGAIGTPTVMSAVLGGPRAMMFRNGTHFIDALCFFAESEPRAVSAILEEGFDDWDRYRGDGGKLPENEPGMTGTILFENGIRALFRVGEGDGAAELAGDYGAEGGFSYRGRRPSGGADGAGGDQGRAESDDDLPGPVPDTGDGGGVPGVGQYHRAGWREHFIAERRKEGAADFAGVPGVASAGGTVGGGAGVGDSPPRAGDSPSRAERVLGAWEEGSPLRARRLQKEERGKWRGIALRRLSSNCFISATMHGHLQPSTGSLRQAQGERTFSYLRPPLPTPRHGPEPGA